MTHPFLPTDDALREELHNEVHARPSARVRLPALIVYVAVLNEGITREDECQHLRALPEHERLTQAQIQGNFLRLRCEGYTVKWERHTEFTRYTIIQSLPTQAVWGKKTGPRWRAMSPPARIGSGRSPAKLWRPFTWPC
jgi:uncharacterized membrane-anchored protein